MKRIINPPFNALVVYALLMLGVAFLQSCSKNKEKENAPVANFVGPANNSFPTIPPALDSTLFKDMIAYWPLDSTALDYSGNGNNGVEHVISPGGGFNGIRSYITVPDAPSLRLGNTDFTISATIVASAYSSSLESEILDKRGGGANNGWHLALSGTKSGAPGHFIFNTGDGSINIISKDSVKLNTHFYVATVEYFSASRTVKLYIHDPYGEVLDTIVKKVPPPNAANTAKLYIGSNNPAIGGDSSFFKGNISQVRIYTRTINIKEQARLLTAAYNPAVNIAGIVACWPLVRNANDISGNNNNGTMHNVVVATDRFGNAVGACGFNGKNSYISVADNPALRLGNTDFSLNAWVYLYSYDASVGSEILSKRLPAANSGWAWSVVGNTGTPVGVSSFGPGRGELTAFGATPITLNAWHMVTNTYTVSDHHLKIYMDGVLNKNVVGVTSPNALINAMLYIGSNGDTPGSAHYFNGRLSDIRIFKLALGSEDINDLLTYIN